MIALPEWLTDALRGLAELRRGRYDEGAKATAWFDGFWDFYVLARPALDRGPTAAATGATSAMGFCVLAWMPEIAADLPPLVRLDLFLEPESRESQAGWPVTTISLRGGGRLGVGPMAPRRVDAAAAGALVGVGACVHLGHSGAHLSFVGAPRVDAETLDGLLTLAEQLIAPER